MKRFIWLLSCFALVKAVASFSQTDLYNPAGTFMDSHYMYAVTSGDVYNDGHPVVILGDEANRLIFLEWANDSFLSRDTLLLPFKITNQIGVFDLDNDGIHELIVSGYDAYQNPGQIHIYQYAQDFVSIWDTSGVIRPVFAQGDLNNDNNMELVICSSGDVPSTDNFFTYSFQNGTVRMEFAKQLKDALGGLWLNQPAIGDFNDDGTSEVAVANDYGYTWLIGCNNGVYQQLKILNMNQGNASQAAAGNVDTDDADELLLGTNNGLVRVLSHQSNWNFGTDWSADIGSVAYEIEVKNIDSDTQSEFAVLHSSTNNWRDGMVSLFDDASQNCKLLWSSPLGAGWYEFHLADVDCDSSVELLVIEDKKLTIYETRLQSSIRGEESQTKQLEYQLQQNYPNPFNAGTTIAYSLPRAAHVSLKVFDAQGRFCCTLVNSLQREGTHTVFFDGSGFASGVYFCKVHMGNDFYQSLKMLLIK